MSWDGIVDMLAQTAASFVGRISFYFFKNWWEGRRKIKTDFMLDRFIERGQSYVGIHNGNIALPACEIEKKDSKCAWWDYQSIDPRNI